MTRPRYIVRGQICFVTAEAVKQMFQFVPRPEVVRVFRYLLAVAAHEFDMKVHEVLCMSNHFHMLMTDVHGQLPDFMHYFDSLLARSLNSLRGTSGAVFEKDYNLVVETDEEKILEHAVYTLANPCKADLVRRSKQWPGFSTLRMEYGQTVRIERPRIGMWKPELEVRSSKQGRSRGRVTHRGKPSQLPDVVEFRLERPPICERLEDAALRAEVRRRLDERELEYIRLREQTKRGVLGERKIVAQPWYAMPESIRELFGTQPTVAGRRKWARIEALQRKATFEMAYANARQAFLDGVRDVVWPLGTWLMRVRFGLPSETSPP